MKNKIKEIERYLPEGWKEKCRELKALVRGRQIKTAEELLTLNLLYLTVGGSFGTTSTLINLTTDKMMSKKAVYTRIQNSGEWLKWMCERMCLNNNMLLPKPQWLTKNIKLVDGSWLCVKGSKKSDYMLHYAFNPFEFTSTFQITDRSKGESLVNYELTENDIVIGDRVYVSIRGMEYALSCGADFILRYRDKAFNIYSKQGDKIDLLKVLGENKLKPLENTSIDCFYMSEGKKRPVRVVAVKKTPKSEEESIRKMKRRCSRSQRKEPSYQTVELNKYIIFVTSMRKDEYSNEKISELYRVRWQIEEVFYRLKTLFNLGEVPSKRADSVKAWFYGKLFLAILVETIIKRESFSPGERSNPAYNDKFMEKFADSFDIYN